MMKKRWYVIDSQENTVTWSVKHERGEEFASKRAASKRAAEMAEDEPHKAFFVCETIDAIVVETKPVKYITL